MADRLGELARAGVSIWLDDLNRKRLATGSLLDLVRDKHVVGVTTNPTIFQRGIGKSDLYDEQIHDLAVRGVGVDEALRQITTSDVRAGCDVLRQVYEDSNGVDGRVSIEVDPGLAHDTEGTIAQSRLLWRLVDRPNLFVKIPGTVAGLPAITRCLAEGISINVTLIFSLPRYAAVIDAFLDGAERARAAGHDLSRLASVASFFVSRVDTEIDQRLDKLGTAEAKRLRGRAAIANARLAFQIYEQAFASCRWAALAAAGAHPQRPLWASTGVKDPAYDDTRYVADLIADGVVNTMPEATLEVVADHGVISGDSVRGGYADSAAVLTALAEVGIDYADVVDKLEQDGLATFEESWAELAETLGHKLVAARGPHGQLPHGLPAERSRGVVSNHRYRRRRTGSPWTTAAARTVGAVRRRAGGWIPRNPRPAARREVFEERSHHIAVDCLPAVARCLHHGQISASPSTYSPGSSTRRLRGGVRRAGPAASRNGRVACCNAHPSTCRAAPGTGC